MKKRKVKIVCGENAKLPAYKTEYSAGADLYSSNTELIELKPNQRILVPTSIRIAIPNDAEAQIRPRSGLAVQYGVHAILGTIDADYRGEIGIILINHGEHMFLIEKGMRLAQIVFNGENGLFQADWVEVEDLDDTKRGDGGFGHTGLK